MKECHRIAILLLTAMLAPRSYFTAAPASVNGTAPDCQMPESAAEQLWCAATAPDSLATTRLVGAIARMQQTGGACETLATVLSRLLQRGLIRIYDPAEYPGVGAATPAVPGAHYWLLLSRDLTARYFDAAHRSGNIDARGIARPETLQGVLAHEADHLLGAGHLDREGYLTPHTEVCGDLR